MSFDRLSVWLARQLGRPAAFVVMLATVLCAIGAALVPEWRDAVLLWGGALTGYVSLLFLAILQNSQNREMAATQAKFDEIIRATDGARNELIRIEERPAEEIAAIRLERLS